MTRTAISVQGLGKRFRRGELHRDRTIREALARRTRSALGALWERVRSGPSSDGSSGPDTFWALKDLSFEVHAGEVLGLIGRNGSGKTTFLKILSRITEPTRGRVEGYGRVGSLLEVGTGFHPELTGRENVYLNGAILGMKRSEIDRKFDQIVSFAGVDTFLDTPVKRYSSGMYVRLAFSVAAHLEPDILLVDEVLAVGDVEFQRKCLGRMDDIAGEGRTVIFVSHNMGLIQSLCDRAILLREGELVADGPVEDTVSTYLRSLETAGGTKVLDRTDRRGTGRAQLAAIDVGIEGGPPDGTLETGQPAVFTFHLTKVVHRLFCHFSIYDRLGREVAWFGSYAASPRDTVGDGPDAAFVCRIDELPLLPGRYRIDFGLSADGDVEDELEGAGFFRVDGEYLDGRPLQPFEEAPGSVIIDHRWSRPHVG